MSDYYAVLQVAPRAEPEVIEAAYRRLARKWHPDTNAAAEAPARIRELNEAYEVLSDPAKRRAYDAARVVGGIGAGVGTAGGRTWIPFALAVVASLVLAPRFGRAAPLVMLLVGGLYWWFRGGRR